MKKYLNIKIINKVIMLSVIIAIMFFGINYTFYEPTEINAFIASKIYKNGVANNAFDDLNFYKCVVDEYNVINKTSLAYTYSLSDEELKTIRLLVCHSKQVVSVDGLEKLTSISSLYLYNNQLTELDVSQNPLLTTLYVNNNQLTELDVSKNPSLTLLHVYNNQLTDIDVSQNLLLTTLYVGSNQLTDIDISKNPLLEDLSVGNNQLTELDVSKNTVLTRLYVSDNQLTELDVTENTSLIDLTASNNQLTDIDVSDNLLLEKLNIYGNQLTKLDVSQNPLLEDLSVGNNQLTELDVSQNSLLEDLSVVNNQLTKLDVSNKTSLTDLDVYNNQLTELDVSQDPSLEHLYAYNNQLTELDVSDNLSLEYLDIYNNQLTELDVSQKPSLISLNAYNNQLTKLDASDNLSLRYLNIYNNKLTELDVSQDPSLTNLDAYNNQLTELDASDNPILKEIDVYNNQLTKLNLNGNSSLELLRAYNNKLTELDVSQNPSLTYLDVYNNQLTELDVSQNPLLTTLYVNDNKLTELDVSQNPSLTNLDAYNNQLMELDVSDNLLLEKLDIHDNQLMKLDVSKNPVLTRLFVSNNQLTELDVTENTSLTDLNVSNNKLMKLDVSQNPLLEDLIVGNNQLTELDISNNSVLDSLDVSFNQLTEIDVSVVPTLSAIYVTNNQLTQLDVSKNIALTYLYASYNQISTLDVSKNTVLTRLYVSNNQLTELDVTENTSLIDLTVSLNPYSETINIYKNSNVVVGQNVKIPEHLNCSSPLWKSEDTGIAIVDENGKVEGLSSGTATITGTSSCYKTTSTINVIEITSEKYEINDRNNYIYIGLNDDVEIIKNNIKTSYENIVIDVDLENNKLYVKYNLEVLKEFKLVRISSEEYNLSKEYIYVGTGSLNKDNINVVNGTTEIKDNRLLIKYGDDILQEYKLVSISSEEYNLSKEYIYVGTGSLNKDNIDVVNGTTEIKDNRLLIKYGDDILQEYKLVSISSEEYNLSKEYIYVGTGSLNKDNINFVNGTTEIKDNRLLIKYGDDILQEYKLVSISSEEYNLSKEYIYVSNLDDDDILKKVNTINCNIKINDNKLQINYKDLVIDEYKLIRISSSKLNILENDKIYVSNKSSVEILDDISVLNGTAVIRENKIRIMFDDEVVEEIQMLFIDLGNLNESNKIIVVSDSMSYADFIRNIVISDGLIYKLFLGTVEVTSGNIEKDMILKVYYGNDLLDMFDILDEYVYIDDSIVVDSDNKYFTNIDIGTKVSDILGKINTSGKVSVFDKNNVEIRDAESIGTGSKVVIELSTKTYEYITIIYGDVDGNGELGLSDIMKIANYIYKNQNSLTNVFKEAADFDNDGSYNLSDIMKSAKMLYGKN